MNSYKYDISIVMAFYNRKEQLCNTLDNFQKQYLNKYNFEVVIIDDNSNDDNNLSETIKNYSFPINLIKVSPEEKIDIVNPCIAYNKGFKAAKGKIIIIQNPECYHIGDILKYTLDNLTEQDYFSYSCYSANNSSITNELINSSDPYKLIQNVSFNKNNTRIIGLSWYNHPTENNTHYHFCSAIHKSKLDLIGGFDERFGKGYCFDDNELLLSIKHNLQLNITTIHPNNGFVIHQYHSRNEAFGIDHAPEDDPIKIKWLKNKNLYENIKNYHESKKFNYPKLLHLYWDGSPLSFLNLVTILSFNRYHKFWKINIYLPIKKTEGMSWKTHEQKTKYEGKCYFHKLYEIPNVFIHKIDFNEIGFDNSVSEVIKSDYFRYHILQQHGGVWSDFDMIYTSNIEDKMNFKDKDTVISQCFAHEDPQHKEKNIGYKYFPVAFFMCKPNNRFFKFILDQCANNYNPNDYQCLGAVMWSKLFLHTDKNNNILYNSVQICNEDYYMPYAYNELNELLVKTNNVLPDKNVAIHWFNGSPISKKYVNSLDNCIDNFESKCFLDNIISPYIKKISIVMAYFNRKQQLIETIKSIKKTEYKNIEITIVDDGSDDEQKVQNFIGQINTDLDIKVITIDKKEKTWINPCVAYNIGIKKAQGDIVIIQNPEVLHVFDCISFVANNIKRKDWISLNCYGSPNLEYNKKLISLSDSKKFDLINNEDKNIGGNSVLVDEVGGWLNHYSLHFVGYHYFGAIHRDDLLGTMNGGFDDNFKDGIAGDDDEFIKRLIYNNFNFVINAFGKNQPFVIHQYHDKPKQLGLFKTNNNIEKFRMKCKEMGFVPENNIHLAPANETPMSKRRLIASKEQKEEKKIKVSNKDTKIKYSILLPYYKRSNQFYNTLISYIHHYSSRKDFEILIGEDHKNFVDNTEHDKLLSIIEQYSSLNIKIIPTHYRNVHNPCLSFNDCASVASGEFLIISNPECFHETNILDGLDDETAQNENSYIICSCLNISNLEIKDNKLSYIAHPIMKNDNSGWLQHSVHNNRMFHFCVCISKKNFQLIEGFDANFQYGVGYEDIDFINKIKEQSNIEIKLRDDLKVLHQNHNKDYQSPYLIKINAEYYRKKWKRLN